MTVEHTEIRHFIQRFNDSYDGFPYGFYTFRTVSARFPAWFGELGAVRVLVVGRFRGLQERLLGPPRAPVGAKTARAARTRRATEDGQRGARPQALGGRNLRKVPPSATICHHLAAKSYPWPTLSLGLVERYPYIWGSSLRDGSVRYCGISG